MWTIFFLLLANVIYIHMCLSSHSSFDIFFFFLNSLLLLLLLLRSGLKIMLSGTRHW